MARFNDRTGITIGLIHRCDYCRVRYPNSLLVDRTVYEDTEVLALVRGKYLHRVCIDTW